MALSAGYCEHVVLALFSFFFLSLLRTLERIRALSIHDIDLALGILWVLKLDPPQQIVSFIQESCVDFLYKKNIV